MENNNLNKETIINIIENSAIRYLDVTLNDNKNKKYKNNECIYTCQSTILKKAIAADTGFSIETVNSNLQTIKKKESFIKYYESKYILKIEKEKNKDYYKFFKKIYNRAEIIKLNKSKLTEFELYFTTEMDNIVSDLNKINPLFLLDKEHMIAVANGGTEKMNNLCITIRQLNRTKGLGDIFDTSCFLNFKNQEKYLKIHFENSINDCLITKAITKKEKAEKKHKFNYLLKRLEVLYKERETYYKNKQLN